MPWIGYFLAALLGYLIGSIPSGYIIARLRGVDITQQGSGRTGGTNVFRALGPKFGLLTGFFDILKGVIAVILARMIFGDEYAAAMAGAFAVMGHNWSIFLRFYGGRGMGTFAGVLLAVFPWGMVWLTALVALGWRLGDSAPWLLVSLVTMPLLAHFLGGPEIVWPLAGVMLLVTFLKRLEANRRPLPPPGTERRQVILRRLFLDRDIAGHEEWLQRRPEAENR